MSTSGAIAVAAVFLWVGMVLGISFLEAPLKFRAPGVTVPVGLVIGRVVFRALNRVEVFLALVVIAAVVAGAATPLIVVLTVCAAVLLGVQLGVVRPRLNRRSDRVLAGEELPRSHQHLYYIGLEGAKVVVLIALGITLLSRG